MANPKYSTISIPSTTISSEKSAASTAASSAASLASESAASTGASSNIQAQPSASESASNFDALFADPQPKNKNVEETRGNVNATPGKDSRVDEMPGTAEGKKSADTSKSAPSSLSSRDKKKPQDLVKRKHVPPPERTAKKGHHHHVIHVDSETDFTKLKIDETKVNILPYDPPVAISQTGLIQAIGRPFNPNHAKYLPDPGDEFKLTRRVSQVKLNQIVILGDVNPKVVEGLAASIKFLSILIGVSSLLFFAFIIAVASVSTPMEYALYFLDTYPLCKAVHIVGVIQPMTVGSYCRFALVNLKHIRSYFLRVPIALGIPIGVILCGTVQFIGTVSENGALSKFLHERMSHYHKDSYISGYSHDTWDGIQKSLACCGYDGHKDWAAYNISYPTSCCSDNNMNCTANSTKLNTKGCKSVYKGSNITLALVFVSIGASIVAIEVISVLFMRSLYGVIGEELYDERHSLKIMWGNVCSLCEVENTDEELEYDEIVDHNEDDDPKEAEDKAKPTETSSTKTVAGKKESVTSSANSISSNRIPRGSRMGAPNKVAPSHIY